ncbi:MAG: hypothetical protein LBC99_05940 [Spirochaetota bacterium]|nr:hypothetical protein [Spirochaetota bacterium]
MEQIEEIRELLEIVKRLQYRYRNKKFTLDGRLIGDIGEIIVAHNYDVVLYEKQKEKYDGYDSNDRKVQIKTTLKNKLSFPYGDKNTPDYYIGIKLYEDGGWDEIYNGPGLNIYNLLQKKQRPKNGYFPVSISTLRAENKKIPDNERIKRRKPKK